MGGVVSVSVIVIVIVIVKRRRRSQVDLNAPTMTFENPAYGVAFHFPTYDVPAQNHDTPAPNKKGVVYDEAVDASGKGASHGYEEVGTGHYAIPFQ